MRYSPILSVYCTICAFCVALPHGAAVADEANPLAEHFGFADLEIYKLQYGIRELHIADLNHDGKNDICVWNPYKNYFDLLYQTDKPTAQPAPDEQNEIPNRGTMRHEKHTVANNVATSATADLTGDGRTDIVFFGEPNELVILPQKEDGGFGAPISTRALDGAARFGMLTVGDFNGDKRTDVALLGDEYLSLFFQKDGGGLGTPTRIRTTLTNPLLIVAADLNGDDRHDLVITTDDDRFGAHVMMQQQDGGLGALQRIKVPKLRSITFGPAENGADIFAVQYATGRLLHYRWAEAGSLTSGVEWPLHTYPLPSSSRAKRQPIAIADLDSDGTDDVVTASADGAQLFYLAGNADGFASAQSFPGLQKTIELQIGDFDNDGTTELLSVSAEERTVGISTFANDRIDFPQRIETRGKVTAAAVGSLSENFAKGTLAYVSVDDDRKSSLVVRPLTDKDSDAATIAIDGLRDEPAGLRFADINHDGRNDLLLFVQFSPLIVFLQSEDGTFAQLDTASSGASLVKNAPLEGATFFDIDKNGHDEILLPQKTFARALHVKDGRWTVVDQFNAPDANAEITGVTAWRDADDKAHVALFDRRSGDITIFAANESGSFTQRETVAAAGTDVIAFHALTRDNATSFLIADTGKLMQVTPPRGNSRTFVEQASYATEAKDAYLADALVGDVNGDGTRDIAVLDIRKAAIEILTTLSDNSLQRALRFQVFQGKRFADAPDRVGEPRIGMMGDVNNDGKDDIVIVVHDRVIVYPGM